MCSAFEKFYLILYKIPLHSSICRKHITFGLRSRYRKIPPAAVANQIAEKARIPPAHERKKR